MSCFVDTNVLVYSLIAESPFADRADRALKGAFRTGEVWISPQVLRELSKVLLQASVLTGRTDHAWVAVAVRSCSKMYRVCEDGPPVIENLLALIESHALPPRLVHDANIVATMQAHGIGRLLTNDRADFAAFADLITIVEI